MQFLRGKIRFDRNELSGAFGDLGTDFPLIVGMILVGGLDATSVLILFGAMQILTGVVYGLPMPVQPLKAMAVIVITQRVSGDVLAGGGLAIGVAMLLLSVTGLIDALARAVPKSVVRGIQFGLGLQLASLALKDYVPADGIPGFALARARQPVHLRGRRRDRVLRGRGGALPNRYREGRVHADAAAPGSERGLAAGGGSRCARRAGEGRRRARGRCE